MISDPVPSNGSRHRSLRQRRTGLDIPIILLLLMLPVSLWASFDIRWSAPKLAGLLAGMAIYYLTVAYVAGHRRLRLALGAFLLLGVIVAAVGLVGTGWLRKNELLWRVTQRLPHWIDGLPGAARGFHPNEVAGILLWFLPPQIALLFWFLRRRPFWSWQVVACCCAVLLEGCTLALTQSRGAMLGLVAGVMAMGALVNRRARNLAALAVVSGLAAWVAGGPAATTTALVEGLPQRFFGAPNWDFRLSVWRAALWGIVDFPFTGIGLGAFRRAAGLLYPLEHVHRIEDLGHAHNGFLQAALDLGVVGLVAYAAIWLQSARMLWLTNRQTEGCPKALAVGFWGGVVSSLVYNLTDTIALGAIGGLPWWFLLGLITGLYRFSVQCGLGDGATTS
jgi:putative inorganic carbon (HCO3(-)) transporter